MASDRGLMTIVCSAHGFLGVCPAFAPCGCYKAESPGLSGPSPTLKG